MTDWLLEHIEISMASGSADTIMAKDQFRVLAYHIQVQYNDASDVYQNRTARDDEVCEAGYQKTGGLPCSTIYSYRKEMTDAHYAQFSTWNQDLPAGVKAALTPNASSTNLQDAARTLRLLSKDVNHWLTTSSRPWENAEDIINERTGTHAGDHVRRSVLEDAPYHIPKRGSSVPAYLVIYSE